MDWGTSFNNSITLQKQWGGRAEDGGQKSEGRKEGKKGKGKRSEIRRD
jgi:hypothetical protein